MTDITRYTLDETKVLYEKPLLELIYDAATVHRVYHSPDEVQLCTLLSIKTGGCIEDCKYCSQSIHNDAELEKEKLWQVEEVLEQARTAKAAGSTRFCMGAAWRDVKDGRAFDRVVDMVQGVSDMGMEACVTLGMLSENQAKRLKDAGLTAYNHNLDTSEEHYNKIISTRTYKDRLDTIENVAKAGVSLCCGGILGLGESEKDRISLLHTLSNLDPQPESVPINILAVARILMPKAMVRLSAGRLELTREAQAMAFMAGANAIFTGDKLLTTPNPEKNEDMELLDALGMKGRKPYKEKDKKTYAA